MSRLYCAFSNIKTILGEGNISLNSPKSSSLKMQNNYGMLLGRLKGFRNNLTSPRKVSRNSQEYSYFKAEYSRGSFFETFNGELLIPSDTVSYVKEKVR